MRLQGQALRALIYVHSWGLRTAQPGAYTDALLPKLRKARGEWETRQVEAYQEANERKKAQNGLGACACFRCKSVESMRAS